MSVLKFTTANSQMADILYTYLSKYQVSMRHTKEPNKVIADFSRSPEDTKGYLLSVITLANIATVEPLKEEE